MRVALDARWCQHTPWGGVGRGIARTVPTLATALQLTLLTQTGLPDLDPSLTLHATVDALPGGGPASLWLQVQAPVWLARHRRHLDGFHTSWYGLPYAQPVPMTCTIHDLSFEHRSDWMSRGALVAFRAQARHAARTARRIAVPSHYVAADLAATYRYPEDRIDVIPNAVDPAFGPQAVGTVSALSLPDVYVVAMAGAQRRREDLAIAAWQAAGRPVPLVVVGGLPAATVDGLHRPGRVPDETWAAILGGATALLYPTEDEGFGMPALEALASRTRVIARPIASLPEVCGDTPVWVDEATPEAFGAGLVEALSSTSEQLDACLTWARSQPTWEDVASQTAELFRRAFLE